MSTVYIPNDTTAIAAGADDTAMALQKIAAQDALDITIVRNGSRGLSWLEPLVEIETCNGRIAYGPVTADCIDDLYAQGFLQGTNHPLCQGPIDAMPFLKNQHRLTFQRIGQYDPLDWHSFLALDGTLGLKKALGSTPQHCIDAIKTSGLRGRGGAAFPAGIKWQTVHDSDASQRYIVCNADEGDSGTFADRLLMEADPLALIEGMAIAAYACQATKGYIYLRSEYPIAAQRMQAAIALAQQHALLGSHVLGSDFAFEIDLRIGAGSYVCGEETALLESLEGKRGMVRAKPPLPAHQGLFAQPTLIHNVLTLATTPYILQHGADHYASLGCNKSRGTIAIQLAGNIARGGLVECEFGLSIHTLINEFGGGTEYGQLQAVQIGGPLGAYLNAEQWHTALDYEALAAINAGLGHGGIVVFGDDIDLADQAHFAMAFCAHESCGKCTPCRIGSQRGVEVIARLRDSGDTADLTLLQDLCTTMEDASLCAMGSMTPVPVRSILDNFPTTLNNRSSTEGL